MRGASLTLVRMLKRYFSLEHSSIISSKREEELGFWEVFKASISAETVWIFSSWKTRQSHTLGGKKHKEKYSKEMKEHDYLGWGVKNVS